MESFDVTYFLMALAGCCSQAISFTANNRLFDKIRKYLMTKAEQSFARRSNDKFGDSKYECFARADKFAWIVLRIYLLLFGSALLFSAISIVQTLYRVFVMKRNLSESFILPIPSTMPFPIDSWYVYLGAFTWTYTSFFFFVASKVISTALLYIFCFYTIAVLQNLQIMANDFNDTE